MRLWRRLTSCKTRSRFVLLSFWYTLLALSAYTLYALKDRGVTSDDVSNGAKAWQRSRFYRALFGQTNEAPDLAAVQNYVAVDTAFEKNLIADDALVAASGGLWAKAEMNAVTGDEERGALHQQSILRGSGAQGIVGQSGKTGVDVNDDEQRTFDLEEGEEEVDSEEEEYVVVGDPHILEYKNRTSDNDAHIPVTSTIDVTSIHFVNSTVKPTPPPEVEGYFNIQTSEKLRLRCSQCALVSSSGHLVNSSAGAEIDSYPCVLRMNSAPVAGYERDVGSKTTIRIVGHVNLKVLNTSNELQTEILRNTSTRAEKIIVPWLYNVKVNAESNMYYKVAKNLSKLYPEVDFYLLTPDKMKIAESLFQTETGLSRQEARTWLSTGWMSMLFAVDVCDKVDIFGLVPENFCTKNPNASSLYHYYEQDGLKECDYYKASEEKLTSGHKFITEKAVFARWATKFNMEFHLPPWNLTELAHAHNATGAIAETPFLKMFYEAKRTGTLPKVPTGSRVVRRVVKRVVKKVIIRRKIPVVAKAPQT